jgi:Asp-tRNA(Asn)/Glu-tRNA(Gln) amidotransferase C subunit
MSDVMQEAELKKLLKLTAIELEPEQVPAFLEYFTNMKQMFDEFYAFPLPEIEEGVGEEKRIACFTEGAVFGNAKAILANVEEKRLVGNAIAVKSAFGE